MRPRFLLTFLGWAGGLSGGDRHLLEMAARWRSHVDVTVLAPPEAAPTVRTFLGDVELAPLGVERREVRDMPREVAVIDPVVPRAWATRTASSSGSYR